MMGTLTESAKANAKNAKVTVKLKADSGYNATTESRISANQWAAIIAIIDDEANACLIDAAPELLAALEAAEHFIEAHYSLAEADASDGHLIDREARRLYETVGAAIAKATA